MVLLSQKLNTKKTVSETIRSSEGHLLTDPQLLILHVSHKLVDSLHLLQLFSPLDQRLLNLGESGKIYELKNNLFYTKLCKKVLRKLCFIFSTSQISIKLCLTISDSMWESDCCVPLPFCHEGLPCLNHGLLVWIYLPQNDGLFIQLCYLTFFNLHLRLQLLVNYTET